MKELLIAVPSYCRAHKISNARLTVSRLCGAGFVPTVFVRATEENLYKKSLKSFNVKIKVLPKDCDNIGSTRNAILAYARNSRYNYVLMADDDLTFSVFDVKLGKLRSATENEIREHLAKMITLCDDIHPIVGANLRGFAIKCPKELVKEDVKVIQFVILNVRQLTALDINYRRDFYATEDLEFQLNARKHGLHTLRLENFLVDNQVWEGGVFMQRNAAVHNFEIKQLARDYKEFVTLRVKGPNKIFSEEHYNLVFKQQKQHEILF